MKTLSNFKLCFILALSLYSATLAKACSSGQWGALYNLYQTIQQYAVAANEYYVLTGDLTNYNIGYTYQTTYNSYNNWMYSEDRGYCVTLTNEIITYDGAIKGNRDNIIAASGAIKAQRAATAAANAAAAAAAATAAAATTTTTVTASSSSSSSSSVSSTSSGISSSSSSSSSGETWYLDYNGYGSSNQVLFLESN